MTPAPLAALLALALTLSPALAAQTSFEPATAAAAMIEPLTPEEELRFAAADDEGRWLVVRASLDANDAKLEAWALELQHRRAYVVLEWLAIYGGPPVSDRAVRALQEANAPQWIRASVWIARAAFDSHGADNAIAMLQRDAAAVNAWLDLHGEPATRDGEGRALFGLAEDTPPADASHYAPPLTPELVYQPLVADGPVRELREGERAEEGVLYRHQVVRAIDGFARAFAHPDPWSAALAALIRSPDVEIAQHACLAYAHFLPGEVPHAALLELARDESAAVELRQAALIGFSYGPDLVVYAVLHGIAFDPVSPLWQVAVSRLGDLGDAFTARHLAPLASFGLPAEAGRLLAEELERIRARGPVIVHSPVLLELEGSVTRRMLERAAWVELTLDPLAGTLVPWIRDTLTELARTNTELRARLVDLGSSYEPIYELHPPVGSLRGRVRELALEIARRSERDA